MLGLRKCLR